MNHNCAGCIWLEVYHDSRGPVVECINPDEDECTSAGGDRDLYSTEHQLERDNDDQD